jgi:regulator of sigma E protease
VEIEVHRPSEDGPQTVFFQMQPVDVDWSGRILGTMEIPSLGIAYEVLNTVAAVVDRSPAARAGFLPGDHILDITLEPANEAQAAKDRLLFPKGRLVTQKIVGKDDASWVIWLRSVAQNIQPDTSLNLSVERDGVSQELRMPPAEVSSTAIPNRGFVFVQETDVMRAGNLVEAISLGWRETKYSMLMVYRFLHKLVSGQVSPQLLGGPGTIAAVAGMSAKQGLASLLLFLTMLSANLAVINFLPIPVLDGGHMLFLLLEAIFRRPVSEKIVIPLTWAGLLLILALMLYVIGLDVNRFIL